MKTSILLTAVLSLITTAAMAQSIEAVVPEAVAVAETPVAPEAPMTTMHHDDGMTLENGKWMKDGRIASKAEIVAHEKMMQMHK